MATATLRADGLNVTQVQQVSNDTAGTVISTDPAADSLVKKGDTVTLKVAEAPPPIQVTVPDGLTNTTQGNADGHPDQSAGLQSTVVYQHEHAAEGHRAEHRPGLGDQGQPGLHGDPDRLVGPGQRASCRRSSA